MECPGCGHPNASDATFCDECGARLEMPCPTCGETNRLAAKFCKKCGGGLAGLPARRRAVPLLTPTHLVEKVLTSRSAVEGERKQVTVLFADIKGSLELLEGRDPEDARRLLDPALHAMMEAVHRYEGTVNQVLGDGIMALFGAPLAHEDHAVRACYAALAMQAAIRRYTEAVRRSHGVEIQVRIGINSGEVVVRAIGNDLHMDYTAIGQTTHLAARMEQMAMPGSTRLTADTLRLAEGFVQVNPLGPVPVKGLPEPVQVFELIGAGATRTRLQASAARGLTPFVGRQAELQLLQEALDHAGAGHGRVVALVGEAGVGKSRLFREFTDSHRSQGWLVLESGSVSYGRSTVYLPVIDLLTSYFQIDAGDDPRKIREKITGKLLTLDQALQPALSPLLTLFDVPVEEREWRTLEPPQRRQATLEALKRLLLRESQVQPLLLVFEDLHWIDSESEALLDGLVESLPTARLLLLVSYRPEYRHGWSNKSYYSQRGIDPLSRDHAGELLETLLGGDRSLVPLKRLLIERTEGNPFFLEESVRTLAETAALVGERGAYRLAHPLEAIQMPPTIQAVLAARIDRLPLEEKRLLQSASVVGKDVPFVILGAIADLPEAALRRGLAHLQAAEFLYEASLYPDLEYTFRHAVTHEVAYASLLHERRRELHARIVEVVERLYPELRAEQIERLATHARLGEVWERAVPYLRQAGTTAFERSANREAVACFERALEALEHLPESRQKAEGAIDLRFDLRNALFPLGEQERIGRHLHEAEELAARLADQPRLGRVYSYLTNYFVANGDHDRAIAAGERALAIAGTLGDFGLHLTTSFHLGQLYASLGDYRRAAAFNRSIVESVEGDAAREAFGRSPLLVLARTWLMWCLAEIGEFREGLARGEGQLRVAQAMGQPFDLVTARLGVGLLYLRRGDLEEAVGVLEPALPLCQGGNLAVWFAAVASPLGYAYALSGRSGEAIALLERAVETTTGRGGHALRMAHLAEAYLLAGRVEDGATLAVRALEVSRDRKERGHEAYVLRLLAEVARKRDPGDVTSGQRYYREAIAVAEELGMRPLMGRCRLALGTLYRGRGQQAGAEAEISAARELFRSMGMESWVARAEALTVSDPSPRRSGRRGSAPPR